MRRVEILGLACLTILLSRTSPAPAVETERFGDGPGYRSLSRLAVLHSGRVKPIDTLAREEVKQIHGRETIRFFNDQGDVVRRWEAVAAVVDWGIRPEFWNEQPFITVEYLPLKYKILASSTKSALKAIAEKPGIDSGIKSEIDRLVRLETVSHDELKSLLKKGKFETGDESTIKQLASKLGEGSKYLSPDELENARVSVNGAEIPFTSWVDRLIEMGSDASMSGAAPKLDEVERKASEVGEKLARYRMLRDRQLTSFLPLLVVPRPVNSAYLKFTAMVHEKIGSVAPRELPQVELEALVVFRKFLEDVPRKDWASPGTDSTFDQKFTNWLKRNAEWVPLTVLLTTKTEDLAAAGYPAREVEEFKSAYKGFEEAELADPGRVGVGPADRLVAAARSLGRETNPDYYPTAAAIDREVGFNRSAPFFYAPWTYGAGLLFLLASLIWADSAYGAGKAARTVAYVGGMALLVGGIVLELYGFTLRILITGWAPVTNMYETVVWVSLIVAVIGLILELIYFKTYAAIAASGVALLGTMLAATVPLLDPTIKGLVPVLRSNLWLSIHVLTEVSSYAAFALAMGLGLIACWYYLTATYRRSPKVGEILFPILVGAPLGGLGYLGLMATWGTVDLGVTMKEHAFWPSLIVSGIGLSMTVGAFFALFGEILNGILRSRETPGESTAASSVKAELAEASAEASNSSSAYSGSGEASATAVLTAKNAVIAKVRAAGSNGVGHGNGNGPVRKDPRDEAMRRTAEKIKPLSMFMYRSIQVGVLLITAGTILGGVWADYSWGRFWGWDPKETWALITLLVYLVPLHGRFAGWVNSFWLTMFSVGCFLAVVMAWYGVNFVLGVGLHSYGFGDGAGQGYVFVACAIVLGVAVGAFWRRSLGYKPLFS